MIQNIYLFS